MRLRPLLFLLLLFLAGATPLHQADAASLGQWTSTTAYPLQVAGESCAVSSNDVYCVGGFDAKGNSYDNVYYSTLSSSGVGAWASTTPYPAKIDSSSCVISNAVIYCVGGENSTSVLSNVYEAQITSSGVGPWSQAAAYPQTIAATSCFVYSGYIYCVGGFDITGDETASSYYASLSSGLSSWMSTTSYPFAVNSEACMVQGDYVYCVAGNEESGLPQFPVAEVYYAELSSSGIGPWTTTTQYPEALSTVSCVLDSGYIYCAGGFDLMQISSDHVYLAAVTDSGVASWTNATAYPFPFDVSSCVSDLSNMYCFAGRSYEGKQITMSDDVYYASLGTGNSTAAASTASTSTTVSTTTTTQSTSTTTIPSATSASTTSTTSTATTSSGNSSTSTTTTVPEFNAEALMLTTFVTLSATVLLLRTRVGRRGVDSER